MKISPKTKKFLKIAAVVGVALFGYRYGMPAARFKRDASNPATWWGAEVRAHLGAGATAKAVSDIVAYHVTNNTQQFQRYVAKGWALAQGNS